MPPRSLIAATRDRYFNAIRSVQPPSRWKILVVDNYTKTLLNSVLKMYDVLQQNVSTVENIEMARSSQATFEAAYLLCPTSKNVERIIADLAPSDGKAPQYAAGHIFFVDPLSNNLVHRLTSSPAEPKLRQLIELYTNFWPTEAQVFLLKTPQSFFTLFQPPGGTFGPDPSEAMAGIEEELHFATQTLLSVCVTLNEFPHIRYYNPAHPPLGPMQASAVASTSSARMGRRGAEVAPEHFTRRLALKLQSAIDDYVKDNEPKPDPARPKGVLFITDRSMDITAPFLHEFSYQAMCHDLLKITDGNKYQYRFLNQEGEREDKEATLSDEDNVWVAIRHLHIAEAIDKLSRDFKQHAGEQGQFTNNNSSLNDMRDMLASLPHMQEMKDKLSLHLTMAQACMNRFEQSKLPAQAMVEQNCATRATPDGQKPRTLVEEMVPLLDAQDVSNADKVRIIALYVMYADGVPDEDRRRLFQHARLGLSEMDTVNNLVHLGARVLKDSTVTGWDAWFKKGKRKQVSGENEYELSRYQPLAKLMVEDHFAGRLEQSTYPYVRDAPPEAVAASGVSGIVGNASGLVTSAIGGGTAATASPRVQPSSLRSAKPTWHQKGRPGAGTGPGGSSASSFSGLDATRQRVIVFVAGGMTYSEIRSAYQLSEKLSKDVYIGSSHVFTPETFMTSLRQMGKAGGGAASARNYDQPSHAGHSNGGAASRLSAPSNDVSGIRAAAMKAKNAFDHGHHEAFRESRLGRLAPGGGSPQQQQSPFQLSSSSSNAAQVSSYDQALHTNQNIYDKRYGAGDASATSPGGMPASRGKGDAASTAQRTNSNGHTVPAYPNGGQGNYATIGASSSFASSLASSGQMQYPGAASLRTASPAPSSQSFDTNRLKDSAKKRLKNPFASLKKL